MANESENKLYRITTFPLNRERHFILAEGLPLEKAKEMFAQVTERIASNNHASSFDNPTYVYLDEDTDFFNESVVKSAYVDGDGNVAWSEEKKDMKDASKTYEIEYYGIPVTYTYLVSREILYPVDFAQPAEYDEAETEIDYVLELDPSEVAQYFEDAFEDYEELKDLENPEEYIETHLDELFDKYYEDIKGHFEETAKEEAQENYEPDDDSEPYYDED